MCVCVCEYVYVCVSVKGGNREKASRGSARSWRERARIMSQIASARSGWGASRVSCRYSDRISCRGKYSSVNVERSYQL